MRNGRLHIFLAVLLVFTGTALADGFFAPSVREIKKKDLGQSQSLVSSPKQEAILATDGKLVQVVLRTHFSAGPKDLAWIVPVPARPIDIAKADDAIFDKLQELAAPKFEKVKYITDAGLHLSCGCAAPSGTAPIASPLAVKVVQTGRAGIFDFHVLSAEKTDDLVKWLTDNNYRVPAGAAETVKLYVDKKWHWLAIRVSAEDAKQPTVAPHPITYSYASQKLVFPLAISRLSAADETEIILYVVGDSRYAASEWKNYPVQFCLRPFEDSELEWVKLVEDANSPSGTNYEEIFRLRTAMDGGHALVTEFARNGQFFGYTNGKSGQFDDVLAPKLIDSLDTQQTLTRLRAFVFRHQMDQDIVMAAAAGEGEVDNTIKIISFDSPASSTGDPGFASNAVMGLLALTAFAACLLFHSGQPHAGTFRSLLLAAGLACLLFV